MGITAEKLGANLAPAHLNEIGENMNTKKILNDAQVLLAEVVRGGTIRLDEGEFILVDSVGNDVDVVNAQAFYDIWCPNCNKDIEDQDTCKGCGYVYPEIVATFTPQAWVDGYAVNVDPSGPVTWNATAELAKHFPNMNDLYRRLERGWQIEGDLDFLQESKDAPVWVQIFQGPFEVKLSHVKLNVGEVHA